ncbi:MAG: hypothetical protein ISS26_01100 [Candidatus Omnitrophica bacterium]|nr:hypothetical protein [Candidatus Omnitrophota bacterium]
MIVLVKLLGIVIVVMGVVYLLKPEVLKQYIAFWAKDKRLFAGAIVSAILGAILLFAASQCRIQWIVTVIGLWAILKGILILLLGKEKMVSMIKAWQKKPAKTIRAMSFVAIIMGALLIFAA